MHVARFTFDELCARPLSAVDYLEITRAFGTIFVTDVPKLRVDQKDMVSVSLGLLVFRSAAIG